MRRGSSGVWLGALVVLWGQARALHRASNN